MMVLEKGIVWGADVVTMQEPYEERKGYNVMARSCTRG